MRFQSLKECKPTAGPTPGHSACICAVALKRNNQHKRKQFQLARQQHVYIYIYHWLNNKAYINISMHVKHSGSLNSLFVTGVS